MIQQNDKIMKTLETKKDLEKRIESLKKYLDAMFDKREWAIQDGDIIMEDQTQVCIDLTVDRINMLDMQKTAL